MEAPKRGMLAFVDKWGWGFMLDTNALCRKVNASNYPLTTSSWMRTFTIYKPFSSAAGGQMVQMQA